MKSKFEKLGNKVVEVVFVGWLAFLLSVVIRLIFSL